MAILMEFEGIPGNATFLDHDKWVTLDSYSFGNSRNLAMVIGQMQQRESGTPHITEVTVSNALDISGGPSWDKFLRGTEGKLVKIHCISTADGSANPYMTVELERVMISSFTFSCAGNDRPTIVMNLNFTNIRPGHAKQEQSGSVAGAPTSFGFSVATGAVG